MYPLHLLLRLLIGVFLLSTALPTKAADVYQPPASAYAKLNFNLDWRLAKGSFPFDSDSNAGWERISTPHTYHDLVGYQATREKEIYALKDAGPHTYRKHFKLPAAYADRKLFLEFQGIKNRGHFILNGHDLGRHENGVTPFGLDITPYVKCGEADNVLQVEIDVSLLESGTNTKQSWLRHEFNPLYGGIVRNVFLHVTDKTHATLPLYTFLQTSGIYAYAQNISTEKRTANIGVDAEVQNDDASAATVSCQSVLVDNTGQAIATLDADVRTLAPGARAVFSAKKSVAGLHFWQPGYPYLYQIHTIVSKDGKVVDVRTTTTGFRKIEIRGSTLYVNNRVMMTMGYAQRFANEWPGLGSAYPDWLHQYSNQLMVENNANMVRWMHCMPSPQDTEACDRIGLTQMFPGADLEHDAYGREWQIRSEIMRDTIIYNRNNPSVVLWETGNERISKAHTEELYAYRDKWDPHGMRPMGGRSISPEFAAGMFNVIKETKRLSIDTEYMRDESARRWWDQWSPPYFHTAEISKYDGVGGWDLNQDSICVTQAKVYQDYYKGRPGTGEAICNGGMKIIFSDTDTHARGVDPFRRSGTVDAMRIKKDSYGAHTAMWSNTPELWTEGKPAIFMPGHWNYPDGTVKPVYVFNSPGVEKVELFVNDKPVSGGKRANMFYTVFDKVPFTPGEIRAVGYDVSGKAVAQDSRVTVGKPARLKLSAIQGPTGLRADGQDVALIETEVVDEQGRRYPHAFDVIDYQVEGPANWKGGIWEEDVGKYMGKKTLPVTAGVHRVSFRSTLTPGVVTITATAPGLEPATITVTSQPVKQVNGLSPELPAIAAVALPASTTYGPDLPPAPRPAPGYFDEKDYKPKPITEKEAEFVAGRLNTAAAGGSRVVKNVKNGAKIYSDQPWTFENLPAYLEGADYIQTANAYAGTAAAEGFVFTIFKPSTVYIAYDTLNPNLPSNNSGTVFTPTGDTLVINGHQHRLYKSGPQTTFDILYLGTSGWPEKPAAGSNNYIVFIKKTP